MPLLTKYNSILLYLLVAFLCLSVSKNYISNHYHKDNGGLYLLEFSEVKIADLSQALINRDCKLSGSLSDRHRLRWVVQLATLKYLQFLTGLSTTPTKLPALGFSFLIASYLFITFITLTRIIDRTKPESLYLLALIYSFGMYYTLGGLVSEISYSTAEVMFISCGLYFSLRKMTLPMLILVLIAPLNRESGLIISGFWMLFNGIRNPIFILLPLASLGSWLLANLDMINCFTHSEFLFGSGSRQDFVGLNLQTVNAILRNYGIFVVSLIVFWAKDSMFQKKLLVLVSIYAMTFVVATPLDEISIRLLIVPFFALYITERYFQVGHRFSNKTW